MHKSEQMMQTCLANGWKAQVKPEIPEDADPGGILWKLYALRNKETIQCTWLGNRMQGALYTHGDNHRLILNWRNQVLKLITGKPDLRKLKGEDIEKLIETRYVPWSYDTPSDKILAELIGRKITWIRSIDREICNAIVSIDRERRFLKLKESPPNSGRRVLEWADTYGFHAVRLDSIIDVS